MTGGTTWVPSRSSGERCLEKMMAARRRITRRGFCHGLVGAVLVGTVLTCGPFRTAGAARKVGQPDQSDKKADVKRSHPVLVSEFSASDTQPDGDLDKHFWSTPERVSFDQAAFVVFPVVFRRKEVGIIMRKARSNSHVTGSVVPTTSRC